MGGMGRIRTRTASPLPVRFPPKGVCVLESRHARGFAMPPTRHDYFKILLIFSGEGSLAGRGGASPLAAGDAAAVPPGCEHWLEDRRPLSLYALCFHGETFREGWPRFICESGKLWVFRRKNDELLALARRLLHEQLSGRRGSSAMVRGLAWQCLALLARLPIGRIRPARDAADPTGSRARAEEAGRALRHRFYEPLSIGDEAARAGLGRRRFTQLFREVHGRTWWEALNATRLEHAERLLRETSRSVAAVAFECGYGDLSGFYRAWGARHRTSPQVWRQRFTSGARKATSGDISRR